MQETGNFHGVQGGSDGTEEECYRYDRVAERSTATKPEQHGHHQHERQQSIAYDGRRGCTAEEAADSGAQRNSKNRRQ